MSGTRADFHVFAAPPRLTYSYVKRTVRLGFRSLWMHRLRSLLTVLGIVFGVCSVIAMLAVGEGASHEAQEQIRRLGSNNIILKSIKPPDDEGTSARRTYSIDYGLTYDDLDEIRATIPGVTVVVPGRIIRQYVWHIARRVDCDIVGTIPWYSEMRKLNVIQGRFFTTEEMNNISNVCVLGESMAAELFPMDPPVGNTVRVGGAYYRVIGVIQAEAATATANPVEPTENGNETSAAAGASHRMYIPLTAAKHRFGETLVKRRSGSFEAEKVELHEAIVRVDKQEEVLDIAAIITEILQRERKKKDFEIVVPLELLRQAERTKQIFNVVLGSIAAISLLVGGIGIMNIMLATVTERTREIGIRRALGARRHDIIIQFLIETVILSCSGGLVGVLLGVAIPFAIARFANMVTIITPWSPFIAFSISAMIGVLFGIYPAFRAANMDPVEALRHE
ncbi:MAG: ABC transporter permease [Candidatus Hydrogenedentes bacterium]|nr:ABC transporter permease [Candidatus Hydrogenedentota bacterium]